MKRVRIPKAGSKQTRPLGIPTVTDRVVQRAVRMVILCRSADEAGRALEVVQKWMEQAHLKLHPEKRCMVNLGAYGNYFRLPRQSVQTHPPSGRATGAPQERTKAQGEHPSSDPPLQRT